MTVSISIITTAYRTRDQLPVLLTGIEQVAAEAGWDHEVIVVDDACPERSGEVAEGGNAQVVRLGTNAGQRTAVLVGMRRACKGLICTLDGDGQDDPGHIPLLVAELERTGVDVMAAGRRGIYEPWLRRATARAFRWLRWTLSRGRIPPDAGLFHVARREAVAAMLDWAGPESDLLVGYATTGAVIGSLPLPRRPRPTGRSSYSTVPRLRLAAASLRDLIHPDRPSRPLPVPSGKTPRRRPA